MRQRIYPNSMEGRTYKKPYNDGELRLHGWPSPNQWRALLGATFTDELVEDAYVEAESIRNRTEARAVKRLSNRSQEPSSLSIAAD